MGTKTWMIGFYEVDKGYGGPEEGGWWFDTMTLVRPYRVCRNEEQAVKLANRGSRLLQYLQRKKREVSSMAYDGGRHCMEVFETKLPEHWPEQRPHYE